MPNRLQLLIGKNVPVEKLRACLKEKKSTGTLTAQELDLALRTAARIGTPSQLAEICFHGKNFDANGLERNLLDLALVNPDPKVIEEAERCMGEFNDGSYHLKQLIDRAVLQDKNVNSVAQFVPGDFLIVNMPNQAGRTLLFYAAAMGHGKMVDALVKQDKLYSRNERLLTRQLHQVTMLEFGEYIYSLRNSKQPYEHEQQFRFILKKFDELLDVIKNDSHLGEQQKNRELVKAFRQKASLYSFRGEYYLNHLQELLESFLDTEEKRKEADAIGDEINRNFRSASGIIASIPETYLTEVDRINNRRIDLFIWDNLYTANYYRGLVEYNRCQLRAKFKAFYPPKNGTVYFGIALAEMIERIEAVDNETVIEFLTKAEMMFKFGSLENEALLCNLSAQIFSSNPKSSPDKYSNLFVNFIKACEQCTVEGIRNFIPNVLKLIYSEFQNSKLPNEHFMSQLQVPENLKRFVDVIKKYDPIFEEKKSAAEEAKQLKAENVGLRGHNTQLEREKQDLERQLALLQEAFKKQAWALGVMVDSSKEIVAKFDVKATDSQPQTSVIYGSFHQSPKLG